jgi:hypothetical protein
MPIAALIVSIALLAGTASGADAQLALVVGGAVAGGTLQTPYVYNCDDDPDSRASGSIVYAGVGYGAVSATAGYTDLRDAGGLTCRIPDPVPDGTHQMRDFPRRSTAIWGWAFHLRYAPPALPLMAHVGAGFETEGNRFRTIGLALRTRGRLRVFGGVELVQLRTPYIDYEQVWLDNDPVTSEEVGHGHEWRELQSIRIGLEYHFRLTGGD